MAFMIRWANFKISLCNIMKYLMIFPAMVPVMLLFSGFEARAESWQAYGQKISLPQRDRDAMELMRTRICSDSMLTFNEQVAEESVPDLAACLKTQQADGAWPDINYGDQQLKDWDAGRHLFRLLVFARAYYKGNATWKGNAALRTAIHRGLAYWYQRNPVNPNWWWMKIGAPDFLADVLLYAAPDAPWTLVEQAFPALESHQPAVRYTGENLIWVSGIRVKHGLLAYRPRYISEGCRQIAREIYVAPDEEGIQPDMSFHQHGKLLYSGGYGQGFVNDVACLAWVAHGTHFALPQHKMQLLENLILDGSRWMVRGRTFYYGAVGREISRAGHDANRFYRACQYMSRLDVPRQDIFQNTGSMDSPPQCLISGNKYFWCSDLMIHQRPGYFLSARMHSSRLLNNDDACCGGEGRVCHHMADGATFMMRDGEEYRDVFPAWGWRNIPGATIGGTATDYAKAELRSFGEKAFAGGASDGMAGCAATDFSRNVVKAKKSWFFFEDIMLALGSDISSTGPASVSTTINQCRRRGKLRLGDGEYQEELKRKIPAGERVWHDGFGYLLLQGNAYMQAVTREGAWSNCGVGSKDKIAVPLFILEIMHGVKPAGDTYAYAILSDSTAENCFDYPLTNIQILSNTPGLQSVWHAGEKRGHAVFYEDGEITFPDGMILTAEAPLIVLYHPREDNMIKLTYADPAPQPTARMGLEGKQLAAAQLHTGRRGQTRRISLRGNAMLSMIVHLPEDDYAGSSQTITLRLPVNPAR